MSKKKTPRRRKTTPRPPNTNNSVPSSPLSLNDLRVGLLVQDLALKVLKNHPTDANAKSVSERFTNAISNCPEWPTVRYYCRVQFHVETSDHETVLALQDWLHVEKGLNRAEIKRLPLPEVVKILKAAQEGQSGANGTPCKQKAIMAQIESRPSLLPKNLSDPLACQESFRAAVRWARKAINDEVMHPLWGDFQNFVDYLWGAWNTCFPDKAPPVKPTAVCCQDAHEAADEILRELPKSEPPQVENGTNQDNKVTPIPGGFEYRQRTHNLTGRPMDMLKAILESRHQRCTANEIRQALGINDEKLEYPEQAVKDTAKKLRKALKDAIQKALLTCQDPLPSNGEGEELTYSLAMP